MATAQVVSATTVVHDEKLDEQTTKEPQEETTVTSPQPSEDQLPKEFAASITFATEPEPKTELKALAAEVETKVVLKEEEEEEEEEGKVNPVDQTAKVSSEPCVDEEVKTETEVGKVEVEEKAEKKEVSEGEELN